MYEMNDEHNEQNERPQASEIGHFIFSKIKYFKGN